MSNDPLRIAYKETRERLSLLFDRDPMADEKNALSLAITRLAEYEGFSTAVLNRRIKAVQDAAEALAAFDAKPKGK